MFWIIFLKLSVSVEVEIPTIKVEQPISGVDKKHTWKFQIRILVNFSLFLEKKSLGDLIQWLDLHLDKDLCGLFTTYCGERGGSVVECRTPEREVRGSRPTAAVLCP